MVWKPPQNGGVMCQWRGGEPLRVRGKVHNSLPIRSLLPIGRCHGARQTATVCSAAGRRGG